MRGILVALRDAVDRGLHPWRRNRARQRLRATSPRSFLFVCLGNICRSPYAERHLSLRSEGLLAAVSAGFIGPGRHPPENAISVARSRGIDHSDHVSQILTRDVVEAADVIFIFDRHNARRVRETTGVRGDRICWLGDFDPQWAGKRAIADPWSKPVEEFERTFERIERCIEEVVRCLEAGPDVPK